MADIALRFFKDMLTITSPLQVALDRRGVVGTYEQLLALVIEPETVEDALRVETVAKAPCMVPLTRDLTPARLAQVNMQDKGELLAKSALEVVRKFKPQHLLVELGPCGLPLDASSKASLQENRDQYARAARLFQNEEFDAFFLNGFTTVGDLQCALMGLRMVTDRPIMASVDVQGDGMLAAGRDTLRSAGALMAEYGASVAGFATTAAPEKACDLAKQLEEGCREAGLELPLMATLVVEKHAPKQFGPTPENPYYTPDTMMPAALALREANVQFLRAAGDATPAYTGVLTAACAGLDVKNLIL